MTKNGDLTEKLSPKDKAYFAGLFDGEGCISCTWSWKKRKPKKSSSKKISFFPHVMFVITNKSRLLLQESVQQRLVYGGIYRQRDVYNYRVTSAEEVLEILNALSEDVRLKRDQLDTARDLLNYMIKHRNGNMRTPWLPEEKRYVHDNYMKKLNKLLPNGEKKGRKSTHTIEEILS